MESYDALNKKIFTSFKDKFGYANILSIPKITKIVVSMGIGEARENPKVMDIALKDLGILTGQKPLVTKAKKAVSGFKIRQGDSVGLKVTLRGKRMREFIDRLSRITLPRIRDFRGLKLAGFDKQGNYNLGIKEHVVFPEIKYDKAEKVFGLQVTFTTTAKNKEEAKELLILSGFPFEK